MATRNDGSSTDVPTTSNSGGGLSHSSPLVTVAATHGGGIRTSSAASSGAGGLSVTTPAGSDHPLAAELSGESSSIGSSPASKVSSSQTTSSTPSPFPPSTPGTTTVLTPSTTLPRPSPAQMQTPGSVLMATPPRVMPSSSAVVTPSRLMGPTKTPLKHQLPPAKKTLDGLADAFLSGPSYRLTERQLPPLLKPPVLPASQNGMDRLRTLVERRAWGDVLQVSGDMLHSASSPHAPIYSSLVVDMDKSKDKIGGLPTSPSGEQEAKLQQETVEILTLECHAWLKLRRYADLGREVDRWSFSRTNDVTAQSPEWVPWSLHILAAESLQYTDTSNITRCNDELCALRNILKDKKRWMLRVDHGLASTFVRQKEWRLALLAMDHMLEHLEGAVREETNDADLVEDLLAAYRVEIISRQGRILLEVGAVPEAAIMFERASQYGASVSSKSPSSSSWIIQKVPSQLSMNDGLVKFAENKYEDAMTFFKQAVDYQRGVTKGEAKYAHENFMGPIWVDGHHTILTQGWNNMALAALYTCRMKEAVRMMETLVREDPTAYLTERLAFNLCTLYELGADSTSSARKKRVLQLVAKRFYLHDIGPESFRVS